MFTRWILVAVLAVSGCDAGLVGDGEGDGIGDPNDPSDPNDPGDPGVATSCKRVDLVFAVDDSGSMQEEKDAMRNDVFPSFAGALLAIGDGLEDYRIGVLDACPAPASFHTSGQAGACGFSSGQAWMSSDSPDLISEFQCVGDILSDDNQCSGDNDDEQPASSAAASLEPPMVGGGPNDGFMRDDALLVVIAITDEDEQPTPATDAQGVYQRLVDRKGGDVSKMVFLGIGGSRNCDGVYGSADEASQLKEVTALFEADNRGLFWDLCDGRLEDGLTAAMEVIESACEDFCNDPDGCDNGDGNPPDDGETPPVL